MPLPLKFAAVAAAGVLTLGGVGLAATAAPTASADTTATAGADTSTGSTRRVDAITDALGGLVSGGTLTQEQADAVAATLADADALRGGGGGGGGHHGGRLFDLGAAVTALGLSRDELRTALQADGATLTTVAAAQGVEVSALGGALTAAATDRIEKRVADGDITRAEGDEKLAELPDRITALLTAEIGHRDGSGGPRRGN